MDAADSLRKHDSRPETPDLNSLQGRRNPLSPLLDNEGAISRKFEDALGHIFAKYATSSATDSLPSGPPLSNPTELLRPRQGLSTYISEEALDRFARETNGSSFSQETKQELRDFLDVNENGYLTFKGFLQLYQLQTENDEEETWRDLSTHGFDRNLDLVSTRSLTVDEGAPVPMNELRGLGMGGEQITPR